MARPSATQMTRSDSSTSSAFSNIVVKMDRNDDDTSSVRSTGSTLPTSYDGASTTPEKRSDSLDTTESTIGRATRKRKSVNYNENAMSEQASARNVSGLTGRTLVDEDGQSGKRRKVTPREVFPDQLPPRKSRTSIKERVKGAISKVGTVLGKRGREEPKILKELDMGTGGLLDELDFNKDDEPEERPIKKLRKTKEVTVAIVPASIPATTKKSNIRQKQWLTAGLYVGQKQGDTGKQGGKKLQKKSKDITTVPPTKASFLPLPMFDYLEKDRQFKIPYDIFATSFRKGDEKPKDWHQLNRNRLIGEAKELYEHDGKLESSLCICSLPAPGEIGCGEDCLNRAMHYECDKDNCALPDSLCSNRAFAELGKRMKKGGPYDIGVEVVKTYDRGFGVRACRTFEPGEIVMEYTGEIISEAECQRRMRDLYAGKQSYYIMEFDQGLHIDGTKGSMARFVNHSCEPNCEVRLVKVSGKPRMAIFAGENGVFTGQELTYDYNFDNFSDHKQQCYCGTASCRGHLARRLNATEQKQKDKEDREKQRLEEIEAQKRAIKEQKQKEERAERGSGWRGWKTFSEIKEELKKEKAARAEAEKNSARAQRMAARHTGAPRPKVEPVPKIKREKVKAVVEVEETEMVASAAAIGTSRFCEDLPRGDQLVRRKAEVSISASYSEEVITTGETTAGAKSKGAQMLKSVEQVVKDGLKQGKSKIMRQSTLSFVKA